MNQEPLFERIARGIAGQLSASEEASLKTWRDASAGNEGFYQSCLGVWQDMDPGLPPDEFDDSKGWQDLVQRLNRAEKITLVQAPPPVLIRQPKQAKPRLRPWILSLAALAVFALLGLFLTESGPFGQKRERLTTKPGQRLSVTLADGSRVRLNGGSQLSWQKGFAGQMRMIEFSGQAYFQVVADSRPFVVKTSHAQVRVLGTTFDIWARNEKTRVMVSQGRVVLEEGTGAAATILTKNQMAQVVAGKVGPSQTVNVGESLGWLQDRLVFKRQPLADVAVDLENWFGVAIEIADSELGPLLVTGSFQSPSLITVLSEIGLALNLKYEKQANRYVISR